MLSKSESRDRVDVPTYNAQGNLVVNKLKKKVSKSKSMTKLLDKQYPLTASISRTRKHVPYDESLDLELNLESPREEKIDQKIQVAEASKNNNKLENGGDAKAKLAAAANAEADPPAKPKRSCQWQSKIDNRLQEIDSALEFRRQTEQTQRKMRMSIESFVEQGAVLDLGLVR